MDTSIDVHGLNDADDIMMDVDELIDFNLDDPDILAAEAMNFVRLSLDPRIQYLEPNTPRRRLPLPQNHQLQKVKY